MFKTHNFAVALDHNIAWMSQMSKLHFPFKFYHVAIQNMRWKLLFNLMSSLTFTVFSIIFGSHDICSQSLPWDRNYEWIATFKILDSCPVISCVAVWKVLKLKILLHSSPANHVRVKYCSQNITTITLFLIV